METGDRLPKACLPRQAPRRFIAGGRGSGFTLVELLIVLGLVAMLLTISLPRFLHTTDTARERARAQNLATLRDAIDKFKADQGHYPTELPELVRKRYLRAIPVDPVTQSTAWSVLASPVAGEAGIHDVAAPADSAAADVRAERTSLP